MSEDLSSGRGRHGAPDRTRKERARVVIVAGVSALAALFAGAGLQAVTPFDEVVLSGRLREVDPDVVAAVANDLAMLARVRTLNGLPDLETP